MEFDLNVFATRFLGIFIEAAPFLLLGTLASGLIEAFVRKEDLVRFLPRNAVTATIMGSLMGFVFPVCECGVVPVTRRLFNKGLPMSVGIAFLMAAPVMNPVVVASTYAAFGTGPVFFGRFIMTAIVAISVGLIFALQTRPQRVMRAQSITIPLSGGSDLMGDEPLVKMNMPGAERMAFLPGLKKALLLARGEFFDMGRFLVIGSLLAAAMSTFAIDKELETLASNPVNSVLSLQLTAFILSVCSTVDSFLALAFTGSFTTGSILGFLVFGPMVDIKSTLMFLGVFKRRVVVYLIVLPFLMTALMSIALNLNVSF